MPPQNPKGTKDLAILITNPQPAYAPGDTITGLAFRQVPVLIGAHDVTITIRLRGEAEVKITQWSDHFAESQRTYATSFDLFDSGMEQTVYQGPVDIPRTVEGIASSELGEGGYG